MGIIGVVLSLTINNGRFRSESGRIDGVSVSRLRKEGIEKGVCILPRPVRASLGVGATSLMRKMPRTCSERLII